MTSNKIFIMLGSTNTIACVNNALGVMNSFVVKKTVGFSNGILTNKALFEQFITEILIELKIYEQTLKEVVLIFYGKIIYNNVLNLPLNFSSPKVIDNSFEKKIANMCKTWCQDKKRYLIHTNIIESKLDNEYVADPIGLRGQNLEVVLQIFSGDAIQIDNLLDIFKNLFLNVIDIIPIPLTYKNLITKKDMLDLGLIVLDFGGQTTTITGFYRNQLLFVEQINIGGDALTRKLAQILNISLDEAERLKTIYGSAKISPQDAYEWIEIPLLSGKMLCLNKSKIVEIVSEYLEHIIINIKQKLKQLNVPEHMRKRITITGEFAKINKLIELISEKMNCECEILESSSKNILESIMKMYKVENPKISFWNKILTIFNIKK